MLSWLVNTWKKQKKYSKKIQKLFYSRNAPCFILEMRSYSYYYYYYYYYYCL